MRILGLDIGRKHSGVSFADTSIGVPLALDTIESADEADLFAQIMLLCDEKNIDVVVVGLPLLPSGTEGAQTSFVRFIGQRLEEAGVHIEYLDERYTTDAHATSDGDAKAACELLTMFLQRTSR